MKHSPTPGGTAALSAAAICRRLEKVYGRVSPPERLPVLDELVAVILSQNTSDRNSSAAFDALVQRFPTWDAVRRASVAQISRAIQVAGLAQRKAPRIKAILQEVYRQRGEVSLDFLHRFTADDAMDYLRKFSGVGPKTAACVLLFACGKPVLPVDTHVHRVSQRLGLIGANTTAEQAHQILAQRVASHLVLDFHILLVTHGRRTCMALAPRCPDCVLLDRCPAGAERLSALRPRL